MNQNMGLASFGLDGFGYAGKDSTFAISWHLFFGFLPHGIFGALGSARGRPGSAQGHPAETLGVRGGAQGGGKGPPPGQIHRTPR